MTKCFDECAGFYRIAVGFGGDGATTTTYRSGGSWATLGSTPFTQGVDYLVEIYANNTTGTLNYTKSGAKTVAANKVDIWIDGVLVGDDLTKGALASDVNIDSYMFYGISSVGNVANLFLDDFSYTNAITSSALTPPTLTADATDITVDNNIDITFTDDATWRAAVTAVKIGRTALTVTTDYVLSSGNLQLKPSGLNALLTASGTKSVTIEATGYNNATVSQPIIPCTHFKFNSHHGKRALVLGQTRTVTATAKISITIWFQVIHLNMMLLSPIVMFLRVRVILLMEQPELLQWPMRL
ncbi:MAG: DUF1533 domain-containing protein [Ignavibacteriales bacterium]|nr:DUF1533 domain-containing protein [Ignavibacteriales bacterium]